MVVGDDERIIGLGGGLCKSGKYSTGKKNWDCFLYGMLFPQNDII